MSIELNIEEQGDVRIVRFMRPEVRNPLSVKVLECLDEVIESCIADGGVKGLVFTGTGSVFASGADLREIAEVTAADAPVFARRGQALMTKISCLQIPTAAAVNGFCFGGGLDLALSCDRRLATQNARFAHPGAGLGIMTGWGGTQRLPRLIGRGPALEMFFTAEAVTAQRALSIGLIDEIVDDPVGRAVDSFFVDPNACTRAPS